MLIENQYFDKVWTKRNYKWYINKGYVFTTFGNSFQVKAEDLSKGAHDLVYVKCIYCGCIRLIQWKEYYSRYLKHGYKCHACYEKRIGEYSLDSRRNKEYEDVIEFCKEKHYILISKKTDIDNCMTDIKYICPKHGKQISNPLAMRLKHGCPKCAIEENAKKARININDVETIFKKYGGILLNKESYISFNEKNMRVICPNCGKVFLTSLNSFIKHHGLRCPKCSKKESKGEYKVRSFLETYRINYYQEYRFEDCKYKNPLPFDFYLPDYNCVIEYDGELHFEPFTKISDINEQMKVFEEYLLRDKIKTDYCHNNNILLIRIPYIDFDNISYILYNELID